MAFVLAHLSDAHIGPLPRPRLHELFSKRLTGYMNWQRGRRRAHNMDVLARIVADLKAQNPDHIAMTGDILNIGLPAEFPLARAWIETLGSPHDVSFVPGNHDAYVRGAVPHLISTFAPYASSDGRNNTAFPYLRLRGEVALIGLCSGVPTAPFLASGHLGDMQMRKFAEVLAETGAKGLARVVMIHHPPHRVGAARGRGLDDAPAFERVIAQHGAELVLYGHNHRAAVAWLGSARRPVPVVGVPSASAVSSNHHHRAAYHLFRLEHTGAGWSVSGEARGIGGDLRSVEPLGALALNAPK
ncbi:metallophosphoesterase family protein [Methylovirgula sp. 4M-Z18]|uniref:metallophosphoesterase family protein n=1 Tax=Methylovirgula sp. 4M-Z18 TaxID=2293567 RepID=UPI000E2F7E47|nr:metallophosphoesterase [Methylovirgula sp. 4M-Z18]RFB78285.1 metallophosphoesterase [Methylovirgula sp. 4M-Z18]